MKVFDRRVLHASQPTDPELEKSGITPTIA